MTPSPKSIVNSGHPEIVAMVHIPINNIFQNTIYSDRLKLPSISKSDWKVLKEVRNELNDLFKEVLENRGIDFLEDSRGSVFIFKKKETEILEERISKLEFIDYLLQRALKEIDIYTKNGINMVSIENCAAPYFIGSTIPFEELLILSFISKEIKRSYPNIILGVHILSGNDLESLPIAINSDAYFIRSEISIFSGFRPEGKTVNKSDLAKFYYLRNYYQSYIGKVSAQDKRYPQIWSDLQKKHTVFEQELMNIETWLDNILFMKLEGVILTGSQTGKDISRNDLELARKAIEDLKDQSIKYWGKVIEIPLISGSGLDMDLYKQYVDFIITGTQLKKNKYWENEVDEENVKVLVAKFKG